jgi:nucleoside-diphosphate-sugar epimerase
MHEEDEEINPDLTYSLSKANAERICSSFSSGYGLDIVICRFFNVYGPHQDIHRKSLPFTSYVAKQLVMGQRPTLYNPTPIQRDYIHVRDVTAALKMIMRAERKLEAEIFNICTGTGYSVPFLYEKMAKIVGSSLIPEYGDPRSFWDKYPELFLGANPLSRERIAKEVNKRSLGSPKKMQQFFSWQPKVGIDEGLEEVIQYTRRHL